MTYSSAAMAYIPLLSIHSIWNSLVFSRLYCACKAGNKISNASFFKSSNPESDVSESCVGESRWSCAREEVIFPVPLPGQLCLPAAHLNGRSPWLLFLHHFPATGFLNVRDVPSLQDVTPDVKQLDFSGFLNCWYCCSKTVVPTRY